MEISGEVDITIDQYADFEIDLDTDRLAEVLLDDHEFVSVTTVHGHVRDYCDDYVDDRVSERVQEEIQELRVQNVNLGHDLMTERVQRVTDHEELRETIEEIVRAEICVAFAAGHHKMQDRLNGTDIGIKEG